VPYWYIDTGFAALLILLAVVDEGLGAVRYRLRTRRSMAERQHHQYRRRGSR